MAAGIRKKSANIFVYILLGLLVLGLAGFGVGSFGGNVRAIGTAGEIEIGTQEYSRRLEQELRRLQQQTGQSFSIEQARAMGIDRSVLQGLVAQAAMADHARDLGLSVGDEAVREEIVASPAFQGPGGTFDRESYRFALSQAGMEPAAYEELVRQDTTRTLLQTAVVNGVTAPATYADALVEFLGSERDFEWSRLDGSALDAPVPAPTDAQIQTYYDENPDAYTLAEAKRLTYAWVTPNMIVDQVDADEEALKALYQDRIDEFQKPERRLMERLIFGSVEEAEAAAARLQGDEIEFEALVAERGLTLEDIDLGEVSADELSEPVASAVFAMTEPGLTAPIETDLGPAIFRVNGILEAQNTAYEDVRDELLAEFAEDSARRRIGDLMIELEDLMAGGATLEDLANDTVLELGTIDLRDDSEEPIAAYEEFRSAAAAVAPGDFPEVGQLSDGGLFALRLDEVVDAQLQPLEQVRDEVIAAWTTQATLQALRKKGEALLARLEDPDVDASPAAEDAQAAPEAEGAPETDAEAEAALESGADTAQAADPAADPENDSAADPASDPATGPEDSADAAEPTASDADAAPRPAIVGDPETAGDSDAPEPDADAEAGGSVAGLAGLGIDAYAEEAIRRDAFIEGTPPALVETAFALQPGESDLIEAGDAVYLIHVTDASGADEQNPDITALRSSVQAQTTDGLTQDLLLLYTQAIRNQTEVELNQAAINAVHSQFP